MRASLHIRPAIVLFGDSLTQQGFGVDGKIGWASLLAAAYTRRADVLNRGFSGYNTNHAVDLVPKLFGPVTPDENGSNILFCTVFFGANDAALPGEPQHVPVEQYADNLRTIVKSIRERCCTSSKSFPIIIMTPPPVDEAAWAAWQNDAVCDRNNQVAFEYGAQAKIVADELGCSVVDTWDLLDGSLEERSKYLGDGIHLNEDGNRLVFGGIMDLVKERHPDLAPMEDDSDDDTGCLRGIASEEKTWRELCGLE
ncbi:hypothetical protein MPSEU_001017700 [Mayamaea pseudoterrestris]|nr:hypothetical protein MPSEU_001017700 [Mayamaea pseudoterrestris]